MNNQNLKNLCLKVLVLLNFKNARKIIKNPQTFCFVFVLNTKRRYSQTKPQLKVEIEDGRKAPYKPSCIYNSYPILN